MTRLLRILGRFSIAVSVLAWIEPAAAQVINPTGRWVTDNAGLLSAAEVESLSASLAQHEEASSVQIVIVILPNLGGRDASSYAFELGEDWGVGQSGVDNGIVILVSVGDRQMFIATGYGVEGTVPDVIAGRIIREIMTPSFRQGRFFEGLQGAVVALVEATRGVTPAQLAKSPGGVQNASRIVFILFVIAIVMIVFFVIYRMSKNDDDSGAPRRRRRRRRSESIDWPLIILGSMLDGGGRGSSSSGGGSFGGGFGGFSGGGGSFGGGGAGGSW